MDEPHPTGAGEPATLGLDEFLQAATQQSWPAVVDTTTGPATYRLALGGEPIQLGNVEFRILLYLASRHYHPFTRRAIATAVSTVEQPVDEADVDDYVIALRDQLGVFYDYVQTVPGIGYRFKA